MSTQRTPLDRTPLNQNRVVVLLGTSSRWRVEVVPATGSTNADVAARARDGEPAGLVLTTDDQQAGRGRLDRTWQVPPRASLATSVLLRPGLAGAADGGGVAVPQSSWGWLPLLAGLAVVDALNHLADVQDGDEPLARELLRPVLKWPNDVLLPTRGAHGEPGEPGKVSGILAELVLPDAVVVGCGINVLQQQDELPVPTATSLALVGVDVDRESVLAAWLTAFAVLLDRWEAAGGQATRSGLLDRYRGACTTLGRRVNVQRPAGVLTGLARDVDSDGHLVVVDDDGARHVVAAGDVVHVRPAPLAS